MPRFRPLPRFGGPSETTMQTSSTNKKTLKSISQSTLRILGVDLECHVLDNGERVFDAESVMRFLEALEDPDAPDITEADADAVAAFVRAVAP